MAEVILDDVSRVFPKGVVAVDHVSLAVRDREFVVLVGPSGCGKSTTLRMIAGLEEVSSGTIRIGDRVVNGVQPKDRNIAMVFQNYALYPHMSVYKNMAFGLELRYSPGLLRQWASRLLSPKKAAELATRRHWIAERVHAAADTLGIGPLLDRMPRELSGGERQRVALGRAIVREPSAFLFDEPLSNLDAKLRVEMRRELRQLHQRLATTMIYVTHDQIEAMTLGERIVVMNQGAVQQVGPPMEVYRRPRNRFVAGFLGSPPMNFVDGTLASDNGALRFRHGGWQVALGPQKLRREPAAGGVVLGIRPQDVAIHRGPGAPGKPGVVTLVEPLGEASVVNVDLAAGQGPPVAVASRVPAGAEPAEGETVGVSLSEGELHLFDASTGESLLEEYRSGELTRRP